MGPRAQVLLVEVVHAQRDRLEVQHVARALVDQAEEQLGGGAVHRHVAAHPADAHHRRVRARGEHRDRDLARVPGR